MASKSVISILMLISSALLVAEVMGAAAKKAKEEKAAAELYAKDKDCTWRKQTTGGEKLKFNFYF